MPKVINDLRERLTDAIAEVERLLPLVQRLLPEPSGVGQRTGTIGRHAPESDEPWNQAAADAYWNLWFGPSTLVNLMREEIGLARHREPPRGAKATGEIRDLAPSVSDDLVKRVIKRLERWAIMAERIPDVGEAESWISIRSPGGRSTACPYCRTFGLRMQVHAEQVRCFFPGCVDSDGLPTRAYVERGRMTGEPHLVFRDGTVMGWADD